MPGGRIVTNQEIGARGHRVLSLNCYVRVRAGEMHTELGSVNLEDCGIKGESGAQLRRLCDVANRGIGLAGIRDEE